jgi:hypothetical protein
MAAMRGMKHWRILFSGLVVLVAATVIAVQHDTFLRRWLLPERQLPPTLARRIGDFHVHRVSFDEAVIAVGRAAGKRLNFSESGSRVVEPTVTIDLRDATVEEVIRALLARTTSSWGVFLKETPNAIVVCDRDPGPPTAVGVFRLSEVKTAARITPPSGQKPRDELLERVRERLPGYDLVWSFQVPVARPDPVQSFGDRAIVVTDPMTRQLIGDWLAEKRR